MQIILTDEDNGIVLDILGLELALLDHLLLLLANTLQQHGCRFVIWVLWHQLASDSEVKDFLP